MIEPLSEAELTAIEATHALALQEFDQRAPGTPAEMALQASARINQRLLTEIRRLQAELRDAKKCPQCGGYPDHKPGCYYG